MRVFCSVGNTPDGWQEFVSHLASSCSQLGWSLRAQIGNTPVAPAEISHFRFCEPGQIDDELASCDVAAIHAGVGIIGQALRHAARIVAVPRRPGRTKRERVMNPHDQLPVAVRLSERYGFTVAQVADLSAALVTEASQPPYRFPAVPGNGVAGQLRTWLEAEGLWRQLTQ